MSKNGYKYQGEASIINQRKAKAIIDRRTGLMMNEKLLFNEFGTEDVNQRKIIGGNTTNLFNLNNVKYKWANNLYRYMMSNFWIPEKISLADDVTSYKKLTSDEKRAYDGILSFLVFLDSIQTTNLPNISEFVTAPEVNLIITIQTFQESIHSASYAYMIESIVDKQDRDSIYEKWREDEVLLKRNRYIADIYQEFKTNKSNRNFMRVIIANFLLESLYFYNGFMFFYNLTSRNLMNGTADVIKLIQRDEQCLHPETELLTSTGWKFIEDVTLEDKVAQYDMETDEITFDNPTYKVWRDYVGEMFLLEDNRKKFRQNLSSGHDSVIKQVNKNGEVSTLKVKIDKLRLNQFTYIPLSGVKTTGCVKNLTWIDMFNIALHADGTIDTQRNGKFSGFQVVKFGLKKQRKVDRLNKILKELKFDYKVHPNNNRPDMVQYYIKVPLNIKVYKHFDEWVNIEDCTYTFARLFLSELVHWDGRTPYGYSGRGKDVCNASYLRYDTTDKGSFGVIQMLLSISGFKSKSKVVVDNRKETYKDVYRVYWFTNRDGIGNLQNTQKGIKTTYNYSGKIGCVTMPKGTIVTRNGVSVSITGNCHITLFKNLINEIKNESPEVYNSLHDYEIEEMFKLAVEQEIDWSNHIIDNVLGISSDSIDKYTKWIANDRLKILGLKPIYDETIYNENPYRHLDRIADIGGDATSKSNFFEATVTSYNMSSSVEGWDTF